MCADELVRKSPSLHLSMNVHLVRGHVYWAVLARHPKNDVLIARGTLMDPYPAEANVRGAVIMEAAHAAYEALAQSSVDP